MTRELGMEKSESDCGDGANEEGGSVAGCSGFFGQREEASKPEKWALREDWLSTHPTVSGKRIEGTENLPSDTWLAHLPVSVAK